MPVFYFERMIILEFWKNLWNTVSGFALHRLLPAALILVAGILIVRIVITILNKALGKSKLDKAVISLIASALRVVLLIVVFLIAASSLGIDVSGIVALASVLTLAISLAVQDALANLIGGFTLLNTKPFSIGDYVEIAGQSGTVQQVGLTYTKLLTPDRKTVSIPNSAVVAAQIINYTVEGTRRVDITVNVAYSNDPEQVIAALKEAAAVPTALKDPVPYCAVSAYNESTVGYVLQVWSTADDYWTTLHTVNGNIRAVFKEKGIIMTYPHLNVHLDK